MILVILLVFEQHIFTFELFFSDHLLSKKSDMNSLIMKPEPMSDDDFEGFFCDEEMKVCLLFSILENIEKLL